MALQQWVEPLVVIAEDGTALANSTSQTSLLPASRKFTLPSYFYFFVGRMLKLRARGRISTVVTTPGTLTLTLRFGSIDVFSTGAMTLNTTAQTNTPWELDVDLVCRAIGASTSANLLGMGRWTSHAVIGSAAIGSGGAGSQMVPYNAAPAVGNGFDSTSAQQIDFMGTWSVANASNSIQLHALDLLSVN
jgi:hypothetical protein